MRDIFEFGPNVHFKVHIYIAFLSSNSASKVAQAASHIQDMASDDWGTVANIDWSKKVLKSKAFHKFCLLIGFFFLKKIKLASLLKLIKTLTYFKKITF